MGYLDQGLTPQSVTYRTFGAFSPATNRKVTTHVFTPKGLDLGSELLYLCIVKQNEAHRK